LLGGIAYRIRMNKNPLCTLILEYQNQTHISYMPLCYNIGMYDIGDRLSIEAIYNFSRYKPTISRNREYKPVIGILVMYIKRN
jgi:hypothetical protein